MNDTDLERYSRQLLLPEIDIEGQEKLRDSAIMVIGAGGLGNMALSALAGAGVGQLTLWDGDVVELSNLPRQPLYNQADVGKLKTTAAREHLAAMNATTITYPHGRLESMEQGLTIAREHDLILDCSDNIKTRKIVNQIAVRSAKPLIAGAAIKFEGQLMTFLNQGGACYECLATQIPIKDVACRDVGILNTQVMMIGIMQAHIALKHILDIQAIVDGQLIMMDGKRDMFQTFKVAKLSTCQTCR